MTIRTYLIRARKIGQITFWTSIIMFFALVCLDVYIQLEATFVSKSFWKPPLLTSLAIAIVYLSITYVANQIIGILMVYPQLLILLIPSIAKVAYNLWIRRRKPDYIVIV